MLGNFFYYFCAMKKSEFIPTFISAINFLDDLGGFFPSVIIAQAALESNWGQSTLAYKYNNYFGIKCGRSWHGPSVNMKTGEYLNGCLQTINSNFRVYPSLLDSIRDRNSLLRLPRYRDVEWAPSPLAQITAISAAGYCTAPAYVDSVMRIINANGLQHYDHR